MGVGRPVDQELDVRGVGRARALIDIARLARTHPEGRSVVIHAHDAGAPEEPPPRCRLKHNTFVGWLSHATPARLYHLIIEPKDPT